MTTEKTKPFSKEWWKEKAVYSSELICSLIREGKINKATRVGRIRNYCFKRYAEAYHRERMLDCQELWKHDHNINLAFGKGVETEQNRILGIIEEVEYMYNKNPRVTGEIAINLIRKQIKE